jgi:hypothetical protein
LPPEFKPGLPTNVTVAAQSSSSHLPALARLWCCFSLREQMDAVAADAAAVLVHIVYAYRCCFTDKFSFKATRLSPLV